MRILLLIALIVLLNSCNTNTSKNTAITTVTYPIILPTPGDTTAGEDANSIEYPGDIDTITVHKLNEPLKAVAAFYAAIGGSWCHDDSCDLTTALGLGKQGSASQKSLIRKYFPNDTIAADVLQQDCWMGKDGSSAFSDFGYLTITNKNDTVIVNYILAVDDHGEESTTKGPDIYLFKDGTFRILKRNLWGKSSNVTKAID